MKRISEVLDLCGFLVRKWFWFSVIPMICVMNILKSHGLGPSTLSFYLVVIGIVVSAYCLWRDNESR